MVFCVKRRHNSALIVAEWLANSYHNSFCVFLLDYVKSAKTCTYPQTAALILLDTFLFHFSNSSTCIYLILDLSFLIKKLL